MQGNDISVPESINQSQTQAMHPMSFSEILDGMFSLYRKHFNLFFRIVVIYFFIAYALDKVSMLIILERLSDGSTGMLIFTLIVTTLIAVLVVSALSYASAEIFLGRNITAGDAYQHAIAKYLPMLACYLLYLIVCIVLAITCIGLPFAVYLAVRWGLYSLPILIEDNNVMNALRRSAELIKNTWWRVFGIMLAMFIIYQMIQSILTNSFGIVFFLVTGIRDAQDPGILETLRRIFMPSPIDIGWSLYMIRSFVTTAIVSITLPIITIGSTLLYFDLRIRKEAYDLEMQATQQEV